MKNCLPVASAAIHQVKKTAKTFGNQKLFLTAKPKGHSHLVVLIASHILEGMQVFCSVHIKY